MKRAAVLLLLVCLGASWGAPVEQEGPEEASCTDPVVLGAAREAMDKINKERTEGYVFSLHSLANAHLQKHGENSIVFYLTMNILQTNCSVLSRAHFRDCTVRDITQTPVYGQCKAAIFISRVNRVVRLYKYNCVVRPVSGASVTRICPDCPTFTSHDNDEIKKTVAMSLEKFNKESSLSKHFSLLQVARATSGWGMGMIYNVEYTIQETTCTKGPEKPEDCPPMNCEFAHTGLCRATHVHAPSLDGQEFVDVKCDVFEPEAAEKEKKLHDLGGAMEHGHTAASAAATGHDHSSHGHLHDHEHHHHPPGQDQHSHDQHGHDHHGHAHHGHAHHGHAHHGHDHHHAEGMWRQIPPMDGPVTLPAFPDVPAGGPEAGVTLPLKPDPQIPGQTEPAIGPFPTKLSTQCSPPTVEENDFMGKLFKDDPQFSA